MGAGAVVAGAVAGAVADVGWAVATGGGWALALALAIGALRLRRRLALVGDAAHELRGPVAALGYAVAGLRREPGGPRRALRFEAELERMRAGLADLEAARAGRRAPARLQTVALERVVTRAADGWRAAVQGSGRGVSVRWHAGAAPVRVDRRRLSQALGNLLANAAEHGSGPIEVHAVRKGPRAVRVEVRDDGPAVRPGRRAVVDGDRGRGLRIAERAVREAGGRLDVDVGRAGTVAAVELPLAGAAGDGGGRDADDLRRGDDIAPDDAGSDRLGTVGDRSERRGGAASGRVRDARRSGTRG